MERTTHRWIGSIVLVAAFWLASAASAQLPLCPNVTGINGDLLRYCSNRTLTTNANIRRVVIFIHGEGRDAVTYYNRILADAQEEGVTGTTTLIVPQFITQQDRDENSLGAAYVYWTSSGWKQGNRSVNGRRYSAFTWVDWLVNTADVIYPNLEHVAVVGWSAGGQFVQRYAGMTQMPMPGGWLDQHGVTMSFGVGAPSSYLWLSDLRPLSVAGCPGWNDYRYGLNRIGDLGYVRDLGLTADTIKNNYFFRHIYYMVGTADNDPSHSSLDTGCAASTQGESRLARARNHKARLRLECEALYRAHGASPLWCNWVGTVAVPLQELPGVGHSSAAAFDTTAGRNILFYWE